LDHITANLVHPRSNPDPVDASVRLHAAWDHTGLYFGAVITDSQHIADSSDIWRDDSIELGIDGVHDATPGGVDDHQFTTAVDGRLTEMGSNNVPGASLAVRTHASRYVLELFVPMAALGRSSLSSGEVVGLNLGLHDDDDGGDWDSYLVLHGASTFSSAADWGDLHLLPPTKNSIGGRTWYDLNANGIIDPAERASLSEVEVGVLDSDGNAVAITRSSDDGRWSVADLPPGAYKVVATDPPGALATSPLEVPVTLPYQGSVNFGFLGTTAVVVQRVDIEAEPEAVTLRWQTSFEMDNQGFTVLRREDDNGVVKPLTLAPLPSQAAPGAGASYRYIDTNVTAAHRYTYWIETVPGDVQLGPYVVIVPLRAAPRRYFLPAVSN
jgi:hypothetical protein